MLYTSTDRVVRDGRLIAFAGEQMTKPEAMLRGLVTNDAPEPEPPQESAAEPPRWHEADGRYVCEPCGKDYATLKGVEQHLAAKH